MSNGSKHEIQKIIKKNFIIDYRNAKYQGEISEYERLPQGMGILFGIDYVLVIAQWDEGNINGQCILVYPTGSIFYGTVISNLPSGICVLQLPKYRVLYGIFKSDGQSIVVVNCQLRNTLTLANIATSELNKLLLSRDEQEIEWVFGSNDRLNSKKIEILEARTYSSEEQKWQILEQLSGQTVNNQLKSYKSFAKYHFNTRVTPKDKRLEIIQTKQYAEIRYKKAGIICRIGQKGGLSNRIKLIGYYDCYQEQCDVFLKNKEGIQPQIQEYCEGHSISYNKERPKTCKTNLLNYLRKSAHFVNRFISLLQMDRIKQVYEAVDNLIQGQLSMKNAQLQLQMGQYQVSRVNEVEDINKVSHHESSELHDIKNDIYNKVNKKKPVFQDHQKQSRLRSHNISKGEYPSRIRQDIKQNYTYSSPIHQKHSTYLEETPSRYPKQYLKYTEQSPTLRTQYPPPRNFEQQPYERKYSYLTKDQKDESYHQQDKFLSKHRSHLQLDLNQIRKEGSYHQNRSQNYNYVPKQSKDNRLHNQSISVLTQNYQKIQEELQHKGYSHSKGKYRGISPSPNGTPTSKSPSRYNYLKTSAYSPSGASAKGKRQWR